MIDINSLSKIEKIIYDCLDDELPQNGLTKEESFIQIKQNIEDGHLFAVENGGLVLLVEIQRTWTAKIDLFSKSNAFNIVKSARELTKYLFDNIPLNKIYGMSPDVRFEYIGKKTGWKKEGILTQSYKKGEKYVDETIMGVTRDDFYAHLEKYNKNNNL